MMEIKDLLKEYYSYEEDSRIDCEPPYDPEEELEIIRSKAVKRRIKERKKIYISTGSAAAAVVLLICAAMVYNGMTLQSSELAVNEPQNSELPQLYQEENDNKNELPSAIQEDGTEAAEPETTAAPKNKSVERKADTEPVYTYPPKITAPPYYRADISEDIPPITLPQTNEYLIPKQNSAPKESLEYELDGTEKIGEPPVEIKENEEIPSGSSMRAGTGNDEESGGELWNEEKYFAYLGINPLSGIKVPEDMKKAPEEEKFVMRSPDGTLYNDRRTFTFANNDRTRLLSVTSSREPLTQETGTANIHGVMVGIFDNHMSATAVLDTEDIHLLIESYGLTEEELKTAVYSCAEAIG